MHVRSWVVEIAIRRLSGLKARAVGSPGKFCHGEAWSKAEVFQASFHVPEAREAVSGQGKSGGSVIRKSGNRNVRRVDQPDGLGGGFPIPKKGRSSIHSEKQLVARGTDHKGIRCRGRREF